MKGGASSFREAKEESYLIKSENRAPLILLKYIFLKNLIWQECSRHLVVKGK